jgi:hypothetical protein
MKELQLGTLTSDESQAMLDYKACTKILNACTLGWSGEFCTFPRMAAFIPAAASFRKNLESAVRKSTVVEPLIVYSGQGHLTTLGCILGPVQRLVGLEYAYTGFTSTTTDCGTAKKFVDDNLRSQGRALFLKIHLKPGSHALAMPQDEFEVLLLPNEKFSILGASQCGNVTRLELGN